MKCGKQISIGLEKVNDFLLVAPSHSIADTCVVFLGNLNGPDTSTPHSTSTTLVTAPLGMTREMSWSVRQTLHPVLVNVKVEVVSMKGKRAFDTE